MYHWQRSPEHTQESYLISNIEDKGFTVVVPHCQCTGLEDIISNLYLLNHLPSDRVRRSVQEVMLSFKLVPACHGHGCHVFLHEALDSSN